MASDSILQSLYNVPETKVTTLANGLKVATENSGLSTATVRHVLMHVLTSIIHYDLSICHIFIIYI